MKKLLLLALLAPLATFSQKLENLKAVPEGAKIIITYDISSDFPGDKYDIALYASSNNFSSPLQRVTGDVGNGQTGGKARRIEWDAKNELGNYKGELSFEVRAEVIAAFALKHEIISAKRGKSVQLDWRGGTKSQDVKIELLKEGVVQSVVGTVGNKGTHSWAIASSEKTGAGYQLRFVNGKETITTQSFSIKHKIPMLLKVLPFVAVGVIVALAGGSKSSTDTPASTSLEAPPDMGLN